MSEAHLLVLGARGSLPVSGPEFVRYGGNTTSFAVIVDGAAIAFVDAGTGLPAHTRFGVEFAPEVAVFLSHYHWDHIQGLSMLPPIWRGTSAVTVHGPGSPADVLGTAIRPPLFPAPLADAPSISFASMEDPVSLPGVTVSAFPVNHPQGGLGFRIDGPGRSLAIVADHESEAGVDADVRSAVAGVDVLVHDAQYLPEESETYRGWGHSTFEHAAAMAGAVGAEELVLTSHDPRRTDDEIDAMVQRATDRFPATTAAAQGLVIPL